MSPDHLDRQLAELLDLGDRCLRLSAFSAIKPYVATEDPQALARVDRAMRLRFWNKAHEIADRLGGPR
jgi:hypothetical protein